MEAKTSEDFKKLQLLKEHRVQSLDYVELVPGVGEVGHNGGSILWQVGALSAGRNGVLFDEVITALRARIQFLQDDILACDENVQIIERLDQIIALVNSRVSKRASQGVTGTFVAHDQGQHPQPGSVGPVSPGVPE